MTKGKEPAAAAVMDNIQMFTVTRGSFYHSRLFWCELSIVWRCHPLRGLVYFGHNGTKWRLARVAESNKKEEKLKLSSCSRKDEPVTSGKEIAFHLRTN